jgi:hypothetical protein
MKANLNLLLGLSALIALSMIFTVSGQTTTTTAPTGTTTTAPTGTAPTGTATSGIPPSGSQPAPSGSQPAPSGSSFNPNGGIPIGANFTSTKLPPLDNPSLTPAMAALDDTYLNSLKNIIKYLPPMEQDVIAQCFSSNTDTTRVISPDCYKGNFTDVKSQSAQGIGSELTNGSQATRNSLSCLTKVTQTYGTTTDTAATTINTQVSNIVAGQATFNNCAAAFSKSVIEILNARRRFLLTTKTNIDASLTKNSQGNATGFIYTTDEQSSIISAFKTYADCTSTFVTSMTDAVVKVQALVGQLSACKSTNTNTATTTATTSGARTRGLQTTIPTVSSAMAAVGNLTSSTLTTAMNGATNLAGNVAGALNMTMSGLAPSGLNPKGLIVFDANGLPVFGISATSVTNVNAIYANATAKNNPAWTTLASRLQANVMNMGSTSSASTSYKNMPSLFGNIINRFQEKKTLNDEINKGVRQEACTGDYLFYCTSGSCYCTEAACPNAVAGTLALNLVPQNLTLNTNTNVAAPTSANVKTRNTVTGRWLQTATTAPTGTTTNPTQPAPTGAPTTGSQPAPSGTSTTVAQPPTGSQPAPSGTSTTVAQPPTGSQPAPSGTSTTVAQPPTGSQPAPSGTSTSGAQPTSGAMPTSGAQPASGIPPMSGIMPMNGTLSMSGVMPMLPNGTLSGAQPPASGSQTAPSGSQAPPSGSQPAPQLGQLNLKNPQDSLSNYYVAEGCISGKRFIYSEATFAISGNAFDYLDRSPQQGGIGAAIAQSMNNCGKAFAGSSTTDKQNCRGDMNSQCANSLDQTCRNTGLYDQITNNPQSASAYPDACNSGISTYSDQTCFNWIENNLIKGTLVLDFKNFKNLPNLIYKSISANQPASSRLRYLQTVATSDPTKTDTKAQVSGTINDSDLTVDSATATKIPDANAYVTNLNSVTTLTTLPSGSSNYISISFTLVLIAIFGLFL